MGSSCGTAIGSSDRFNIGEAGWLENKINTFQKNSIPWVVTATRVILIAVCILNSPQSTFAGLSVGIVVGYKWPGAYEIDPEKIVIGCSNYNDMAANRKQPVIIAVIISTLDKLHHMRCSKSVGIPITSYMIGQYVGKEVNAFVKRFGGIPLV